MLISASYSVSGIRSYCLTGKAMQVAEVKQPDGLYVRTHVHVSKHSQMQTRPK